MFLYVEAQLTLNALYSYGVDTKQAFQKMINYREYITIEPGKRSGQPCIRGMRITVADILSYLASAMTIEEIIEDFPKLTSDDIYAALAYAAEAQKGTESLTLSS